MGNQIRYRHSIAAHNNALTPLFHSRQQPRKLGLGLINIDRNHQRKNKIRPSLVKSEFNKVDPSLILAVLNKIVSAKKS
jgi:hypothetical protein